MKRKRRAGVVEGERTRLERTRAAKRMARTEAREIRVVLSKRSGGREDDIVAACRKFHRPVESENAKIVPLGRKLRVEIKGPHLQWACALAHVDVTIAGRTTSSNDGLVAILNSSNSSGQDTPTLRELWSQLLRRGNCGGVQLCYSRQCR